MQMYGNIEGFSHYLGWFQIMTPVFGAERILCHITGAGAGQGRFFCRGRLCHAQDPWRSLDMVFVVNI